jgi:hypothetical protein
MALRLLLPGALCALAAAHLVGFATTLPTVEHEARIADPSGEWRRVSSAALYDPATYRYESALRFLFIAFESGDVAPATRALDLFAASARRAPADAYTWTMTAWAAGFREDAVAATRALRRSWDLAPYNAVLSRERLAIVRTFERPLTARERRDVARDLRVALRQHPAFTRSLLAESAHLAAIAKAERLDHR